MVAAAVWAVSLSAVVPAAADPYDPQWYLKAMKAPEMWNASEGTGITVAVIDSGVTDIPELEGRTLPGASFMPPPLEHPDQ